MPHAYYVRNLPHWQPPEVDIFITWRLHGSLPSRMRPPASDDPSGKVFRAYDSVLDQARSGPLWLRNPLVAGCVAVALEAAQDNHLCVLYAYVLMANHVHVLLRPQAPIAEITRRIKGPTARAANRFLGRASEPFWQDESFDHWVRSAGEWHKIRSYIERNPVTAGLVQRPQDWPWSTASRPLPPVQKSSHWHS